MRLGCIAIMKYKSLLILAALGIMVASCERNGKCGVKNISSSGGNESHNNGRNCMSCHSDGGEGKGCFTAAGSAYTSNGGVSQNVVMRLYTQPNGQGELKATVNGDALGNFYTTENINYSGGLYPTITFASGTVKHMPSSITSGACNSCHGSSSGRIEE